MTESIKKDMAAEAKSVPDATADRNLSPIPPAASLSSDPVEKIKDMFMAAAEADRAMSETFSKLVSMVDETRKASVATASNVLSLILRLADSGTIALSEDEYKAFGLKPKAAKIRAGK